MSIGMSESPLAAVTINQPLFGLVPQGYTCGMFCDAFQLHVVDGSWKLSKHSPTQRTGFKTT